MKKVFKIGTRGSPLALAQAKAVAAALESAHAGLETEIVTIVTSGDRIQDRALAAAGGKGLFTKEIEEALIEGRIDGAVHSMKDVPTVLPDGLEISCLLPREDARDAFFSFKAKTLDELPAGAVVGTASLRRQALVLAHRPDLKVALLRGNVGTRLKKLEEGVVDATLLAVAGLNRLGQGYLVKHVIPVDVMLPAVAQGAVGVECRSADAGAKALLAAIHCKKTEICVAAERGFLATLDGSCRTPLAALMVRGEDGMARFDAWAAKPDGSDVKKLSYTAKIDTAAEALALGRRAGAEMKAQLPEGYLS